MARAPTSGAAARRPSRLQARPQDFEHEVEITLEEAFHGSQRLLDVDGRRLEVKIPPGVKTGSRARMAGEAPAGSRAATAATSISSSKSSPIRVSSAGAMTSTRRSPSTCSPRCWAARSACQPWPVRSYSRSSPAPSPADRYGWRDRGCPGSAATSTETCMRKYADDPRATQRARAGARAEVGRVAPIVGGPRRSAPGCGPPRPLRLTRRRAGRALSPVSGAGTISQHAEERES